MRARIVFLKSHVKAIGVTSLLMEAGERSRRLWTTSQCSRKLCFTRRGGQFIFARPNWRPIKNCISSEGRNYET